MLLSHHVWTFVILFLPALINLLYTVYETKCCCYPLNAIKQIDLHWLPATFRICFKILEPYMARIHSVSWTFCTTPPRAELIRCYVLLPHASIGFLNDFESTHIHYIFSFAWITFSVMLLCVIVSFLPKGMCARSGMQWVVVVYLSACVCLCSK